LISSKYLLREVREIGGAYGGGATLTRGGIFAYFSYRDPNTLQTLKKFEDSVEWLASGDFTDEYIKEAKLSTFQELDKPVTPEKQGLDEFESNLSHQLRQEYRLRLLDVKKADLERVAKAYLRNKTQVGIAILGPENEAIKEQTDFKIVK
jgi:Zn-dependent M16 (insulinase) family peptidase